MTKYDSDKRELTREELILYTMGEAALEYNPPDDEVWSEEKGYNEGMQRLAAMIIAVLDARGKL